MGGVIRWLGICEVCVYIDPRGRECWLHVEMMLRRSVRQRIGWI